MDELEFKLIIGQKIKKFRLAQKLSQLELARKLGVNQSYISNIESGRKSISSKALCKINKYLNVSHEMFWNQDPGDPFIYIADQLSQLEKKLQVLQAENIRLKAQNKQIINPPPKELIEIHHLLGKAPPRLRQLAHALLTYGTLSPSEIAQKENEQNPAVLAAKSLNQ